MKICAECGHGNDDTVTFCAECGEFLDWELDTGSRAAQPADTATSGTKVPIGPRPPSRPPDATDTPDVEPPGSEMEDPDTPADRRDAAPPPPSPSGETDESAVEEQAADSGSRIELNALAARLAIRPASARKPDEDDSPARDGIAQARAVAQRRGRDDLVHRLDQEAVSVRRGLVRVAVVGHFKQGKSTLVNALVSSQVCPVDPVWSTAVATEVGHGPRFTAEAVYVRNAEESPVAIDTADIDRYVLERGDERDRDAAGEAAASVVRLTLPRRVLASGLVLVDTPGVGGLDSAHAIATLGSLEAADGVFLVTDCTQELLAAELAYLRRAVDRCPAAACVMTKADISPGVAKVMERNRRHLDGEGMTDVPIIVVSSTLHLRALSERDLGMEAESGFAELFAHLYRQVVTPAREHAVSRAGRTVVDVTDQLLIGLDAEQEVERAPQQTDVVLGTLEAARNRVQRFRSESAGWQLTLNDGIQDLLADADHDLRERFRTLAGQAEAVVDQEEDIHLVEQQLEVWLSREVMERVVGHYDMVRSRIAKLATDVAAHFAMDEAGALPDVDVAPPTSSVAGIRLQRERSLAQRGVSRRVMTAIQGTTGGAIMATTGLAMTGVGALAALVPVVALPVGVLVGRRAFRDHHERQLNIRRQELKREAQKYVNEVAFGVSKDSKDRLRASQRTLRDHFTARAAELERSLAAAEHAAKDAADGTARVGAGGGKPSAAAADAEQLGVARTIAARMMVARPAARTP